MKELMRLAVAGLLLAAGNALANNLAVTNTAVVTYQPDAGLAKIRFDIAWENSWRYTNVNHDAAWVFFKVRPEGTTNWTHVTMGWACLSGAPLKARARCRSQTHTWSGTSPPTRGVKL
jgi:hypothetical protein